MIEHLIERTSLLAFALMLMKISAPDAQSCHWTQYNDTNIYNGNGTAAITVSDCQTMCLSTAGCQSIDWASENAVGQQCYLLDKKTDKYSTKGVFHYDLDCSDDCSFMIDNNTSISGGTVVKATSLSGCMYSCRLSPTCQSIDWVPGNLAERQCYLLSTQTPKRSILGFEHYDLQCSNANLTTATTATATATTPATTATSKTTLAQVPLIFRKDCRLNYEYSPKTSSPGGVLIPELNDVMKCGVACGAVLSCLGFDFSSITGCWLHYDEMKFGQKFYQADVEQFSVNRCPEEGIQRCFESHDASGAIEDSCASMCSPKWARYENTAGSGGQPEILGAVKSIGSCLRECFNRSDCVGIEWSDVPGLNSQICALYNFSQRNAFATTTLKPFVTQYRLLSKCGTYCAVNWMFHNSTNFRAVGETIQTNAANVVACARDCRLSKTCVMYQVTKQGPFVCTLADGFYLGSSTWNESVETYTISLSCNETVLDPTPTPQQSSPDTPPTTAVQKTTPTAAAETTATAELTTGQQESCEWTLFSNTLIYQGQESNATTLEYCQLQCLTTRTTCRGIDWSYENPSGEQCYLHKRQKKKYSGSGVDHYDLNCEETVIDQTTTPQQSSSDTPPTTTVQQTTTAVLTAAETTATTKTTTGKQESCEWTRFNNTLIYQGQGSNAMSLIDCQLQCKNTRATCRGIDWSYVSPSGEQCFLHKEQGTKYSGSGVDHYDLNCEETALDPRPTPQQSSPHTSPTTTVQQKTTTATADTTAKTETTTGQQESCGWTRFNNTLIYQGQGSNAMSLVDCQHQCLTTRTTCRGIDWSNVNPSGEQCFLHKEQGTKYFGSGVDHYDLNCKVKDKEESKTMPRLRADLFRLIKVCEFQLFLYSSKEAINCSFAFCIGESMDVWILQ